MIDESTWRTMRDLRSRGLPKKKIARELALDIKTVRKWLRRTWKPQHRTIRARALDRWESFLRERAPEVGFRLAVLYRELKDQGYEGSYSSVVRYLRAWREEYLSRRQVEESAKFARKLKEFFGH